MSKKIISIVLAAVMVLAMGTVAIVATSADDSLPEKIEGNNRYYFSMPDEWMNSYARTAGIYWWEGTGAQGSWPGIEANQADVEGVYYYDVATDVTTIIWNNLIDGGMDSTVPIYRAACQTKNIGVEYYDAGESALYPDGLESFDEMIYVLDLSQTQRNDYSGKLTYIGEWYYYYGNGEYGTAPNKEDAEVVYSDRAFNADQFIEDTGATYDETEPVITEPPIVTDPVVTTADETEPVVSTPAATDPVVSTPVATDPVASTPAVIEPDEAKGVNCGGNDYLTNVGDELTYTFTLTTPGVIENVQATVYYDAEKLELIKTKGGEMFPNLVSTIYNANIPGTVKFNASEVMDGFDFTGGATLVTLKFKVLDTAYSELHTELEEMVELMGSDMVTGGQILVDLGTAETITGNTGVEETTTVVTDPTTVPVQPGTTAPVVPGTTAPVVPGTTAPVVPGTTPAGTTPAPNTTDATGATGNTNGGNGTVTTGAATFIYVAIAVITMAAVAVVVLRKRVNG